ncbi:MAG TPA: winged helix-turn-helix domain-containing protein [Nitrososphaera sp.]|nr:winged helix-turn-helix domain-containing protein [Nitrososphaera sp.]
MSSPEPTYPGKFRRGARGTVDIVADILHICKTWQGKTSVMYQANLSHEMLKFYIWHMVELHLLEESDDAKFKSTEKGDAFLGYYQKLATLMAGLGAAPAGRYIQSRKE